MVYLPHWPIPGSLGNRVIDFETVFERMQPVLQRLNNPHLKLPPIIHVAGTNGKGSTVTLLGQIFKCNKNKVHIYSSPHIHHFNERIILDSQMITDGFLYEIMEEVRLASQDTLLTFMESSTIAAFLAFSKVPADIIILECGMGGRIDSTNIIQEKLATIITPISFDHEEYLGSDIRRIALEKAMIMRPNTPLFCSSQYNEAKEIIKILANDQEIDHFYYGEDFFIEKNDDQTFDFEFKNQKLINLPKPNLDGDHQYINFATVLACIHQISPKFKIAESPIRQAIQTCQINSRLQKIQGQVNKLLKNKESEIWIDGAHNESGAFALRKWLENKDDDFVNYAIVGFSRKKCRPGFLKQLSEIAQIIAVRVNGEPHPEDPEKIIEIAKNHKIKVTNQENLEQAIHFISQEISNKKCRIIICGSFYLARDLKKLL